MKPIDILINTMKRKIKPTHKSIKSLYIFLKSPTFREGFLRFDVYVTGNKDNLSDNMCAFLDYLQRKDAESKLTKAIEKSVDKAIKRSDWRVEYMTLNAKIMEEREEAREEGRSLGLEEGLTLGREEERIKNIRKTIFLLHRLNFKNEDIIKEISQTFEISLETAGKYIEDYYNELSKNN